MNKPFTQEHKDKIGLALRGRKSNFPPWNKGKTLSESYKQKIAKSMLGKVRPINVRKKISETHLKNREKSHLWRGGVTPLNKALRTSMEYKLWRESVFKRDKYMCVFGGKEHGNKLNADHIKPFCLFPELRFAIDNGRTLCVDCHKKTITYGNKSLRFAE